MRRRAPQLRSFPRKWESRAKAGSPLARGRTEERMLKGFTTLHSLLSVTPPRVCYVPSYPPDAPASGRDPCGAAMAALHHRADRRRKASAALLLLDPDRRRHAHRQMVRGGHDLEAPVDHAARIRARLRDR